jgi:hypothetical protein
LDITDRAYQGSPIYLMECSCGERLHWRSCQLTRTKHPTCGDPDCRAKSPTAWVLPKGQAAFNRLFRRYKKDAESKDLVLQLTEEEFRTLITGSCAYCGARPMRMSKGISNGGISYNGIDRCRNDQGYVRSNVVSCCTPCNLMKGPLNYEMFIKILRLIAHRNHLLFPADAEELRAYNRKVECAIQSRRVPPADRTWSFKRREG